MIVFKYKKERGRGGRQVFRPVAEVIIESSSAKVEVGMYIDSGADLSLVPLSVGLALGFKNEASEIQEINPDYSCHFRLYRRFSSGLL